MTTKPSNNFNITVSIPEIGFKDVQEINLFYVFRNPIVKQSSFAGLVLPMSAIKYLNSLENLLQQNSMPEITVKIDFADPIEPSGGFRGRKSTKTVIEKNYKILMCSPVDKDRNASNQMIMTRLILVNPVLFQMQESNGFNKIMESVTAFEALEEYEGYLSGQYGGTSFDFVKVGEGDNLNSHSYEHIMTRTENDLCVPDFLLYNKKAFNSFSYYFFDDFRIDSKKTADICGLFVNLFDIEKFTPVDINNFNKNPDCPMLNLLGSYPQFNPMSSIMKDNARTVGRDPEGRNERNDDLGPVPVPNIKTEVAGDLLHDKGREISVSTPTLEKKDKPTGNIINFNNPDSVENGNTRFEIIKEQCKDTIRSFHIYDADNCYPDLYQFDNSYNLELGAISEYKHVPISIINIFKKDGSKPKVMTHGVRMQTIKFKTETIKPK
jgi:hypothetical protein